MNSMASGPPSLSPSSNEMDTSDINYLEGIPPTPNLKGDYNIMDTKGPSNVSNCKSRPKANTPGLYVKMYTPDCLDICLDYACSQFPERPITLNNIVSTFIDIVKIKGLHNMDEAGLYNLMSVLSSSNVMKTIGKGENARTVTSTNHAWDDPSRTEMSIAIAATSGRDAPLLSGTDQRAATAFNGNPLTTATRETEEQQGRYLVLNFNEEGSPDSTPISLEEYKFIARQAFEFDSGLPKDKNFRDFLFENLENPEKEWIGEIIQRNTDASTTAKKKDAYKIKSKENYEYFLANHIDKSQPGLYNGKFGILKKQCAICWICKQPMYLYQIVHTISGNKQQLNACGEMEHVLPPGLGHIIGTLSSHAVVQRALTTGKWPRLSTVSNKPAPSAASGLHSGIGPTHFGKGHSGGSITEIQSDIALALFGLRASCAWCNKVKSDLWFLQIIMKASMNICEYAIYQNRITAFRDELIRLLSDPDEQLFWSYELRFDVSLINSGDDALKARFGIMSAQDFADTCVDNIIKEMNIIINQGSQISKKCSDLPASDGVNRLAIQIQLRTLMGYLVFWRDLLAQESKKIKGGGKVYEIQSKIPEIWSKYVDMFELISTKAFVPQEIASFALAVEELQSSSSSSSSSSSNETDTPILNRKKSSRSSDDPILLTRRISTLLEDSPQIEVTQPPISRATSASAASATPYQKISLFTPQLERSQSLGSQRLGLTPQSSSVSFSKPQNTFSRNMRGISQPAASRNSSSAASSAFATPLQSSFAIPMRRSQSLTLTPQRSFEDVQTVLGARTTSYFNKPASQHNEPASQNNERGNQTSTKRKKTGGTRKQHKLHKQHKQNRNHRNHRTRKQKKNKKTRKIKKLTKRF
jgi:hypothetical protein